MHKMNISNKALQTIVEGFPMGIMVVNAKHIITEVNIHGAALLEYTPEEMIGTDLSDYVVSGSESAHREATSDFLTGEIHPLRELTPAKTHGLSKSGRHVNLDIQIQKLDDDSAYAVFHDPIAYAPMDNLTNTLSREQFYPAMHNLSGEYSLLFIDLNKFKPVNDNYGHLTGDLVLKTVSRRIQNMLRDTDIFCRFGGDEFIVVVPGNIASGETVRKKIEKLVSDPIKTREHIIEISCSVGVSISSETDSIDKLIDLADERMYHSKSLA